MILEKSSSETYGLVSFFSVSLSRFTYESILHECTQDVKYTGDKVLYLLVEIGWRGLLSRVHGPKNFSSAGKGEIIQPSVNIFYGLSVAQLLVYVESEVIKPTSLEILLALPGCAEFVYIVEVDLNYVDEMKEETNILPLCPESEEVSVSLWTNDIKIMLRSYKHVKTL